MAKKIWLVVHHEDLWEIDNRRVGFYRKYQWDKLNEGDVVIYLRTGENRIKGVFTIMKKEIEKWNSTLNFKVGANDLGYQCKLELLSDKLICDYVTFDERFSFSQELANSFNGTRKQVFLATKRDLDLII